MKGKIKYTDEPIGKVRIIDDFLPSPEELVLKEETVKVTIFLSRTSVEFFKKEATKALFFARFPSTKCGISRR